MLVWPASGWTAAEPLTPLRTLHVEGGFTAGGNCLGDNSGATGGPGGGTITIAGIPPGSQVVAAYLWYTVLNPTSPVPAGSPTLNGTPLVAVARGEVNDTPEWGSFGQNFTAAFRADVTAIVRGDGDYLLAGFPASGSRRDTFPEGATIAAVYCQPGGPRSTIVIHDGIDVSNSRRGDHVQTLGGFTATTPVTSARWLAVVGNGQDNSSILGGDGDRLTLDGVNLETVFPLDQVLFGSACPNPSGEGSSRERGYWDLGLYDVTSLVAGGATSAVVSIGPADGLFSPDAYSIAAYVLAVSSDAPATDCCASPVPPPQKMGNTLRAIRTANRTDVRLSWSTSDPDTAAFRLRRGVGKAPPYPPHPSAGDLAGTTYVDAGRTMVAGNDFDTITALSCDGQEEP